MTPVWMPSPNFGPRRGGVLPDMVVLHYTAMATVEEARQRLSDPKAEVSAHYLIAEDGVILALVREEERAWHAGAGGWGSVLDVNSRSIGIEIANPGTCPFSAAQMDALEVLLKDISARWDIRPERVIGHSDMAPLRKPDPGGRFDWRRLALAGLSVWPDDSDGDLVADQAGFADLAAAFGYPETAFDHLLKAVRLRFRPWAKGPLDQCDMAIMSDLAGRFPVDRLPSNP